MATLHIENQVRDFDAWLPVFTKFEQFRAEHGVRAYRVTTHAEDHNRVNVDLDFDSSAEAEAFIGALDKIWATPQSQREMVSHGRPEVWDLVQQRTL